VPDLIVERDGGAAMATLDRSVHTDPPSRAHLLIVDPSAHAGDAGAAAPRATSSAQPPIR
jgi:hypothetical protein